MDYYDWSDKVRDFLKTVIKNADTREKVAVAINRSMYQLFEALVAVRRDGASIDDIKIILDLLIEEKLIAELKQVT